MNYIKLYEVDVVNGDGIRVSLFVSGCEHKCRGCYNKSTWNKNNGSLFNQEKEDLIISLLNDEKIKKDGLTLSGGDPLLKNNCETILKLVKRVKSECNNKDIWLWTGYTFEFLNDQQREILKYVDVLIDGKFVESLKDPSLFYRGSSNQRVFKKNEKGVFEKWM